MACSLCLVPTLLHRVVTTREDYFGVSLLNTFVFGWMTEGYAVLAYSDLALRDYPNLSLGVVP